MNKSSTKAFKPMKKATKAPKRAMSTKAKKVVKKATTQRRAAMSTNTTAMMSARNTTFVAAPTLQQQQQQQQKQQQKQFVAKHNFSAIATAPTFKSLSSFQQTNKQFAEEAKKVKDYFEVTIAAPNLAPYKKAKAHAVYISTTHGERGLLRNAAAAIYTLKPGALRVFEEQNGEAKKFFVPGGVARISADDKSLVVTASEIFPLEELDIDAARKLQDSATAAAAAATDGITKAQHTTSLRVAGAVIKAIERFNKA